MTQPANRKADEFDAEVGARVRHLRKLRGASQDSLAVAVGITFQQVQKYERGTNRISCSMLKKISEHLGAPMSELLGEDTAGEPSGVDWTSRYEPETIEIARALTAIRSPELRKRVQGLILQLGAEFDAPAQD